VTRIMWLLKSPASFFLQFQHHITQLPSWVITLNAQNNNIR